MAAISIFSPLLVFIIYTLAFQRITSGAVITIARAITQRADTLKPQNILLPSSYQIGQDTLAFAAAMSEQTEQIQLLSAIRCGECIPPCSPELSKHAGSYVGGLPGSQYHLRIYRDAAWPQKIVITDPQKSSRSSNSMDTTMHWIGGDFSNFQLDTQPVKTYQQNGGPLLYFGGYSSSARDLCARFCDVYLLWPDTQVGLKASMEDVITSSSRPRSIH